MTSKKGEPETPVLSLDELEDLYTWVVYLLVFIRD
jgi:hypothetical protein